MSQKLLFVGEDATDIIKAGLLTCGKAIFTAKDKVRIYIYRGNGGTNGIKVEIEHPKDEEIKD